MNNKSSNFIFHVHLTQHEKYNNKLIYNKWYIIYDYGPNYKLKSSKEGKGTIIYNLLY